MPLKLGTVIAENMMAMQSSQNCPLLDESLTQHKSSTVGDIRLDNRLERLFFYNQLTEKNKREAETARSDERLQNQFEDNFAERRNPFLPYDSKVNGNPFVPSEIHKSLANSNQKGTMNPFVPGKIKIF